MNLLHQIQELSRISGPVHLAIGVFDGVHLGHQAVIRCAIGNAQKTGGSAVVVTFDPHPARILRPEKAPRILTSTGHKIQVLRKFEIKNLLLIPFSTEFANMAPEMFVQQLASGCDLRSICVGRRWCFGKNRAGDLDLLSRMGRGLGFEVMGVPEVEMEGKPISSTLIRAAIQEGRLADAAHFLGRPFSILGTVEHGMHLGKKLGFPTANLSAHNEQFPPDGVYAARARLGERVLDGVVNIGYRPTVDPETKQRLLELHMFDFTGDLYGRDIEVEFVHYLRPEMKFDSLEDLTAQIARDAKAARELLRGSA